MPDCIFCKIVEGMIPSRKVFESDELIAFEDNNPVAPTHVLVVPKKHIETLNEITPEDAELVGKLVVCAKSIAVDRKLAQDGYRLVLNCMSGAGQTVYHVHLHLMGGRVFRWPPG